MLNMVVFALTNGKISAGLSWIAWASSSLYKPTCRRSTSSWCCFSSRFPLSLSLKAQCMINDTNNASRAVIRLTDRWIRLRPDTGEGNQIEVSRSLTVSQVQMQEGDHGQRHCRRDLRRNQTCWAWTGKADIRLYSGNEEVRAGQTVWHYVICNPK